MKTKNLNMRSSRMRSIQSPIDGWTLDTNVNTLEYKIYDYDYIFLFFDTPTKKTCILPRPVMSPWVNVIFTKDSNNTQFTLTYVYWSTAGFSISNPLPSTATINDINPVYTSGYYCNYNYKNNNDPVIVRTIESGKSIGGFNDNELQLPCRFIVFLEIQDSTRGYSYFYVDVDRDQKVSLSK